jgi:hypothetical protein
MADSSVLTSKPVLIALVVVAVLIISYCIYYAVNDGDDTVVVPIVEPKPKGKPYPGQYIYDTLPAEIDGAAEATALGVCQAEADKLKFNFWKGPPPDALLAAPGECAKSVYSMLAMAHEKVMTDPDSADAKKAKKIIKALKQHWGADNKTLCKYLQAVKTADEAAETKKQQLIAFVKCA